MGTGRRFRLFRIEDGSVASRLPLLRREGQLRPCAPRREEKAKLRQALGLRHVLVPSCMGFVHVLWSAGEFASLRGSLYDYSVLPWPLAAKPEPSENWPAGMRRFWIQAHELDGAERSSVRRARDRGDRWEVVRADTTCRSKSRITEGERTPQPLRTLLLRGGRRDALF